MLANTNHHRSDNGTGPTLVSRRCVGMIVDAVDSADTAEVLGKNRRLATTAKQARKDATVCNKQNPATTGPLSTGCKTCHRDAVPTLRR